MATNPKYKPNASPRSYFERKTYINPVPKSKKIPVNAKKIAQDIKNKEKSS